MKEMSRKLLAIGSGPGGYGTCLNVGCIPAKALIHAAEEFSHATPSVGGNMVGISVQKSKIDLPNTIARKDGIVARFRDGTSVIVKTDMGEQHDPRR